MASSAEHLGKAALRSEPRQGVLLDATVKAYRAAPLAAAVIDLSTGGAMLAADTSALHKGDEIVLDAAGKQIVATVAWSNESFFGLAFHRRLDDREMSWLKRVGRA
ncbi:PilZ domain-containing protein [Sphingomonas sp. CGMCC 1.13654]|uniref:PilZ domain-containing protein n=1 Tax=Sphingomonas chungangi TaxID=2683589 RepID=A0A838LC09_9SPHN|nr:PilZ domain-containing protein [Sphingomonas chungangi]MBA2935676.1 PilZ domain-containing protein [Sphingomonas chungangi]